MEGIQLSEGIIIGVLDTGIFPNHPSFNDEGMRSPPTKWKRKCKFNFTGTFNNKLIGARQFGIGDGTPLDHEGHGTQSASTAIGSFARGANIFGNANGTTASMAPLAHLAIYKTCSTDSCFESEILAASDAAVEDGVDVISISFGISAKAFHEDYIARGAFSAMRRGIFISCSAGNQSLFHTTLSNKALWILTVGASTIDRNLRATGVLGNGMELNGESMFQMKGLPLGQLPLVYPGINVSDFGANYCQPESLNSTYVKEKVVLCTVDSTTTKIEQGRAVKNTGGAAVILINMEYGGFTTSADAHVIPAMNINYEDGVKIIAYVNSTLTPTTTIIFKGTIMCDNNTPTVAAFSSRGPSYASRGILKPDIIGPGVNILAAWPNSLEKNANTKNNFNIMSGTSVSSPYLSGVAALIKSVHPHWSPAAIKSAIMTTADNINHQNQPIQDEKLHLAGIFTMGAGHVNPEKASDLGLIYDIEPHDYIPYLCSLNYTSREVTKIFLHKVNCSAESRIPEVQLNYPSFAIGIRPSHQRYARTMTNICENNESYHVKVVLP